MAGKKILYEDDARRALIKGMNIMVEAVSVTLGPKGRNVVLEKFAGSPQIINDGVSIAREIELEDNIENTGVSLIRQAAAKTNDVAGDGTTTATVLAYAIIKQGMRNVAAGANPIVLKRGIEKATQFVVRKIVDYARPIENLSDITKVATISAGNDDEVGQLIASAIDKVGREGLISLEEGFLFNIYLYPVVILSFNLQLIVIYYWTLKIPELLGNGHIFFAGIVNDVVMGLPMGTSALTYLISSFVASYIRSVTVKMSLFTDWFTFILAIFFSNLVYYFLITNFSPLEITYTNLFYNCFFTFLFFPFFWFIFNLYISLFGIKKHD